MFVKLITAGSGSTLTLLGCRPYGNIPDPGFCHTGYSPVMGACIDGIAH